ncbi:type II toxin-antitoxin system mRNA interferase toxin, RelE/StbE family [Methanobacterium sp.]|uniref:type II toxin-antitoxin system mRNA interferase toxin, RelE/StbE family n=1 Tax=Methanobacterium sp. TaxID=2164 RepID=UPI002ABB2872|nr:type II toxin-antitoxin system mRNA interferase toxin, RelE/StbE family [Methanobacterium sp.]MDY9922274.1 type II toxin-antitoxin system mRNA interferase toxin, RelE/StbE family [Methanobacterium sp.]
MEHEFGGIIIGNEFNAKDQVISLEYHAELDEIREKVKRGHCSTLRECLLLFKDFWAESRETDMMISHKFQKEMEKLSQKNPKQYKHVLNKMEQISAKPLHYKPLSGDLHGSRRTHVGDFVLIYGINEGRVVFQDYNHHDRVYQGK